MTLLPSRLRTMKLDALPHCGIKRSFLGRGFLDPGCSLLLQPVAIDLSPRFLRHALGLPSHLLE